MVNGNLMFDDFKDFYNKRDTIKKLFSHLCVSSKTQYKSYVYGKKMRVYLLDKIWEYLNEPFGSVYYINDDILAFYL